MEQAIQAKMDRFSPVYADIPKIHVLHENEDWVKPLWEELNLLNVPYDNWFLDQGGFDLSAIPPEGIFYNRMSASSHTRGHRYAVELSVPVLDWLEAHGRRVINGGQTIFTEVNKVRQQILLNACGIRTPRTYVANNQEQLVQQAESYGDQPFIVKPNRGGKGLGVQLFHSVEALRQALTHNPDFSSLDGIFLLQEYIRSTDSKIVRMEFIASQLYYAVAVDTSSGFELCPADACAIDDQFCPTTQEVAAAPRFEIIKDFHNPDLPKLETFLQRQGIDIAGIEYITDVEGNRWVYDINTNTNYNSEAEAATGYHWKGMRQLASYLQQEFEVAYAQSSS